MKRKIIMAVVLLLAVSCQKKNCETATVKFEKANNRLKEAQKNNYLNPGSVSEAELSRLQQEYNESWKHKEGVCNK